jgi:hypothetical protein
MGALARPGAAAGQNTSTGPAPPLGSQTVSTLLQTQDLNQAEQAHGGGGGHHGSMKMMGGLEAEEVAGEEEAQLLRRRKNRTAIPKSSEEAKTVEIDDNGVPVKPEAETRETGGSNPQGLLDSMLRNFFLSG